MRVIAGKYGGRKINSPKGDDIRPTTDKIKEALFNILQSEIEGAVVVDLFAGTGGLGIEALSRGAKKVYFCDKDARSIALTSSNLSYVDKRDYEIVKGDYADCIRRLAARGVVADIIICDPPYGLKIGEEIISKVKEEGLLKENGVLTVERATTDGAVSDRELYLEAVKKYGSTSIDVFRNYTKVAVTGSFDPFTNGHKYLIEEALKQFGAVYAVLLVNEEKKADYSVDRRLRIMDIALRPFKRRVKCEFYGGLAADYCREHGIKYIIRGVRNSVDGEYERKMADFNRERGVETLFIPAVNPEISSTTVRDKVKEGESIEGLVDEKIISYLVKEEKWRT